MRIAGVRLGAGRLVWVEGRDFELSPGEAVTVLLPDGSRTGTVFVAPHQVGAPPVEVEGVLTDVIRAESDDDDCSSLPGETLPALGTHTISERGQEMVIAIDAARQRVRLRGGDGVETEVPVSALHRDPSSG